MFNNNLLDKTFEEDWFPDVSVIANHKAIIKIKLCYNYKRIQLLYCVFFTRQKISTAIRPQVNVTNTRCFGVLLIIIYVDFIYFRDDNSKVTTKRHKPPEDYNEIVQHCQIVLQ